MGWDPQTPYDGLPLLPPPVDLESKKVLKSAIEARAALAALDQAALNLPNPAVLLYAMPLLEAQASSEIENIVTTADALFKFAQIDGDTGESATKEALRYRSALFEGVRAIQLATAHVGHGRTSVHAHKEPRDGNTKTCWHSDSQSRDR